MRAKAVVAAMFGIVIGSGGSPALAQGAAQFPSKNITIVVPASPGGAIDLLARLTGQKMTEAWGKPVVIEKANPGKLTFASSGPGGAPHMSGELFKSMAGIEMTHVPYKGSTAAHPDLLSGQVSMMFDTVAAILPQVKSGGVRARGHDHETCVDRAGRADDGRVRELHPVRDDEVGEGGEGRRRPARVS